MRPTGEPHSCSAVILPSVPRLYRHDDDDDVFSALEKAPNLDGGTLVDNANFENLSFRPSIENRPKNSTMSVDLAVPRAGIELFAYSDRILFIKKKN